MTPAEFAAQASGGKDAGFACLENGQGVFHFPPAAAAASSVSFEIGGRPAERGFVPRERMEREEDLFRQSPDGANLWGKLPRRISCITT